MQLDLEILERSIALDVNFWSIRLRVRYRVTAKSSSYENSFRSAQRCCLNEAVRALGQITVPVFAGYVEFSGFG